MLTSGTVKTKNVTVTKLCKIVLNISPASFNDYHFNSMKTKNGDKTKENSTEML